MLLDMTDTIAALCTPPGSSSRAIIRVSGDRAFAILAHLFRPAPQTPSNASAPDGDASNNSNAGTHQSAGNGTGVGTCDSDTEGTRWRARGLLHGEVLLPLPGGTVPCPALLYRLPAPASYTRQDVAELMLPGSQPLIHALLGELARRGARAAHPGEFTLRAFLSGRIGLAQAEAVERIVRAESEAERRAALAGLDDGPHRRYVRWKRSLLETAGLLEATLDFEEEELEPGLEAMLQERLHALARECGALAAQAAVDAARGDGIRVLLAGPTNAGKSALLNRLLAREAAIVSPERSTTRDRTAHPLAIGRFNFRLEDCPGIDDSAVDSPFAQTLSQQARAHYAAAPLLLLVADAQAGPTPELAAFFQTLPPCRAILVCNKCDSGEPDVAVPSPPPFDNVADHCAAIESLARANAALTLLGVYRCSAHTGYGIDALREGLLSCAASDEASERVAALSQREAAELDEAARACVMAAEILPVAAELAATELRLAHDAVSRASGEGYAEDILAGIFSRFCIGK